MNVNSESGHINSNFHKRREVFALIFEKLDIDNPEITQIDNIFEDVFKKCKDEYFQTFEYRCQDDIKFENMTSSEVFYFTITNDFKLCLSQTERLFKKRMNEEKKITNSMK